METNALFYKIQKGSVSTEDYLNWAHWLLENHVSSPSVNSLASFTGNENIFEVEDYFKRALFELEVQKPTFEVSARAYVVFLADKIRKSNNHTEVLELAYLIFGIAATELNYPDDLLQWYEISEMIDRLQYDESPLRFDEKDIIVRIKSEASSLVE